MDRAIVRCAALLLALGWVPGSLAAPIREGDPILIGTKWKGKLTQRGTFAGGGNGPPEFDATLVVTKRDGNAFEADLTEKTPSLKITYVVKGEVARTADGKGHTIKFESVEAKDVESTTPILGVPYAATVTGKSMKGTWKLRRGDESIDISGDFDLELGK